MKLAAITLTAVAPTAIELIPWTDRKNRFHRLRATVFALLTLPALALAGRWLTGNLGADPLNAAIHSTGYWAVWLLLASLLVTPLKSLAASPGIAVIRRMTGNAALIYVAIHLALYATDQKWQLLTVASEIIKRFYLTLGFVALLGLIILGLTSTDGWMRVLGPAWKRLHRLVYAVAVLALVHYLLQSKLDVSQALLAGGVFTWAMMWRALPTGHDRQWPVLLAITAAAAATTLAYEYLWYRFGTHVNALKVIRDEFDIQYGLHPAGQILLLGAAATAATALRQLSFRIAGAWPFTLAIYTLGAFAFDAAIAFRDLYFDDLFPDGPAPSTLDAAWLGAFALLAVTRWRLRAAPQARLLDALWLLAVASQIAIPGPITRGLPAAAVVVLAGLAVAGSRRLWPATRAAALSASRQPSA